MNLPPAVCVHQVDQQQLAFRPKNRTLLNDHQRGVLRTFTWPASVMCRPDLPDFSDQERLIDIADVFFITSSSSMVRVDATNHPSSRRPLPFIIHRFARSTSAAIIFVAPFETLFNFSHFFLFLYSSKRCYSSA
jgi:hypothetical protein